jgi:hypothetical protein
MSRRWIAAVLALLVLAFVGGVAQGRAERFELEGNIKIFGSGNGIIFPDDSKVTSAGFGGVTVYTRTQTFQAGASVLALGGPVACDAGDVVVGGGVKFTQVGTLTQVIYSLVNEATVSEDAWQGQVVANPDSAGFATGSALVVSGRCADVTP